MSINLSKSGQSHKIDLSKGVPSFRVNLNWSGNTVGAQPAKTGFFASLFGGGGDSTAKAKEADLDLGCLYELQDGSKGVIQSLGNSFGSSSRHPYIGLDKDDRSGSATDGENLILSKANLIKRVLVFCYIYKGASDFKTVNAKFQVIGASGSEDVVFDLDNPGAGRTFCAAALLEFKDNQLVVTKQEKYFRSHQEADQAFGFGFNWTAGSK